MKTTLKYVCLGLIILTVAAFSFGCGSSNNNGGGGGTSFFPTINM